MKVPSSIVQSVKEQFTAYSPDWLFAFVYNWLYQARRETRINKVETGWLVQKDGGVELLCPSPKWALGEEIGLRGFSDKFERYFRIEKGDVVLDVGACIGDTTLPMAIKVGAEGKIIAVEPNPLNVKYLKLNLASFKNVEIIEKGIWKEKAKVEFHLHNTPTGHSIIPDKTRKGHMEILVDTLDNLFGNRQIDFAKIDVQYAEIEVLQGGDRFLKNVRKLIVATHSRTDEQQRTYPKVLEILEQYDFQVKFAMDNGLVYAWR
jgi:FkbM family methyltransferase